MDYPVLDYPVLMTPHTPPDVTIPLRPPPPHVPVFWILSTVIWNCTAPPASRKQILAACNAYGVPEGVSQRMRSATHDTLVHALVDPNCVLLHVAAAAVACKNGAVVGVVLEGTHGQMKVLPKDTFVRLMQFKKYVEACAGPAGPIKHVSPPVELLVLTGPGTALLFQDFSVEKMAVSHVLAQKAADEVRARPCSLPLIF